MLDTTQATKQIQLSVPWCCLIKLAATCIKLFTIIPTYYQTHAYRFATKHYLLTCTNMAIVRNSEAASIYDKLNLLGMWTNRTDARKY